MAHPETLLPMPDVDDPVQRFLSVVKFYLSGWHIKPPGVKKPLNPILGETFTCYWEYPDQTKGYYISEQTSHHPPKSSYFFMAPEHNIRIDGAPRATFQTGQKQGLFNATSAKHTSPLVRPLEEQEERESQKLWYKTAQAVKASDHVAATEEKSRIEDRQRDETANRLEQGIEWQPRYFRPVRGGPGGSEEGEEDLDWILNANIDGATPEIKAKQILLVAPILRGQKPVSVAHPNGSAPSKSATSQPPAPSGDLIDFGDSAPSTQPEPPSRLPDQHIISESNHAPPSLQEPLLPGHPIKRVDTLTSEEDEFVDAKTA
ncbi:uncharacterized protein KY384_001472 [Bacidia gigantensis]|uniref:uncharacterized protein n=1 Tax=Bacidia gigantensis TaxID=2732470 RepID=UPI001D04EB8A|nr:uncharacterized protein KY384_001472 [Bacidia gigantensis]KAG8533731.1 hypothetical protein KY384_001472 [Bacidia gigantensis]